MQNFSVPRVRAGFRGVLPFGLLCLGVFWSSMTLAKASTLCPDLKASVAKGGSIAINVSRCDGPLNLGMGGPFPGSLPKNGKVTLGPQMKLGSQTVTYVHNGNEATKDVFYLEDNDSDIVTINITILKSKKRKK